MSIRPVKQLIKAKPTLSPARDRWNRRPRRLQQRPRHL